MKPSYLHGMGVPLPLSAHQTTRPMKGLSGSHAMSPWAHGRTADAHSGLWRDQFSAARLAVALHDSCCLNLTTVVAQDVDLPVRICDPTAGDTGQVA